jgi:uncharacterized membrane protein
MRGLLVLEPVFSGMLAILTVGTLLVGWWGFRQLEQCHNLIDEAQEA